MIELTPTQDANLIKLAQRTVGFLVQVETDGVLHLTPAGSGSIVSIKGIVFFVTAGHVARAIMEAKFAGVYGIMSPKKNVRPVEFHPELCNAIIHWSGEVSPIGPDIAAIKLPPGPTAQIEQTRIVYNVDRRAHLGDQVGPAEDLILCGFPTTATMKNVSMDEWQRHDLMTLTVVAGERTPAIKDDQGFDRFEFTGTYTSSPPPSTFQGVSGGGLWYLDADDPETVPLLAGVAYYQGERLDDGNRILTCAGAESIYAKLLQAAAEKWVP
ncbi:MAG: hypothetical protein EON59_06710 [Alphaproteobacteria bacterium]|nr:MAG: hypothetical protein EON59_06710 [Alphaproteobacteria bacterium]